MTKPYMKPIALAVSLALSLSACGKHEDATNAPAASSTAPAPASTAAMAAAAPKSVFDIGELDSNIQACQDFNGFVNSKWIAANPIPNDRTRWGAFDKLAEDSLNTQHEIVDAAAKDAASAKAGSIEQKIGYLYASGMDEAAIEKIRREADSALERGLAEVHAESTWDDFRKKVLVDAVGRVTASEDATSDADGEFTLPPSSNRFMLAATVEYHPAVGAGFQWLEFFQRDNIGRSGLFLSDKNLLGKTKDSLTLPSEAKSRFDGKIREAATTKPPQ